MKKEFLMVIAFFTLLYYLFSFGCDNSQNDTFVPTTDAGYYVVAKEAIKNKMHNPKSFDLDSYTVESDGANHIVKVSFYGTNGFGGVVKSYAKVTITPDVKTEVELLTVGIRPVKECEK